MTEHAVGVAEMAAILHVSPDTIRRRAVAGEIPGDRIGRQWRFWPDEVRAHLKAARDARDPWTRSAASRRALQRRRAS